MGTVLFAEDEVMLRVAAAEMLAEAGHQVHSAGDGEEALALLKTHPEIDLIISDVRMPRMDGIALAKAGLQFKPNIKILMITAYADDIPQQLIESLTGVLHKPFNLDRLCQVVRELEGQA